MSRAWPSTILESQPLFAEYSRSAHRIGLDIMFMLARKLGIDPEEIAKRHRLEELSGDHVRIVRSPAAKEGRREGVEVHAPAHTDFGTYVLLFPPPSPHVFVLMSILPG